MNLKELYEKNCTTPSDINEHCPVLYALAKECKHVTEFGTRWGVSTSALLYAEPEFLVCYDKSRQKEVSMLEELAKTTKTNFSFFKRNVLEIEIDPTDFLFLDTWHAYIQLKQELKLHADKARKYIAMHDTEKFAHRGDTLKDTADPGGGLKPAIDEFLESHPEWVLDHHYRNNNGLTILKRA